MTCPALFDIDDEEKGMNKNQVEGRLKEAQGTVKEVAGKVVGNKNLEYRGKIDKAVGKVQAGLGDIKEDIKNA
jgi:uncharacterized protein YjbJ (UPF0337 family)